MHHFWQALRLFGWLLFLTGGVYPLLVTGIGQLCFSKESNGSILLNRDRPVGSALIAQPFQSDNYFWPRPSAVDYNPLKSGGSNLGPTSVRLKEEVNARRKKLQRPDSPVPNELLFASGSGLDPHISPEAAKWQVSRVSAARSIPQSTLYQLIDRYTEGKKLKLIGHPRVNVLILNLALDQLEKN